MPTEPEVVTLSQIVNRAVEVVDPDGADEDLVEFQQRFEDFDEPASALTESIESRMAEATGVFDPQAESGPVLKQICTLQGSKFQEDGAYATTLSTTALPGWEEPNAKYFTFSTTGNNATATPNALGTSSGLTAKTRDCATGAET